MRCYLVIAEDTEGKFHRAYAGTNALARQQRDAFVEEFGIKKSTVVMEQAEVPLAKADLITFLNAILIDGVPPVVKPKEKKDVKAKPTAGKAIKGTTSKTGRGTSSKKK